MGLLRGCLMILFIILLLPSEMIVTPSPKNWWDDVVLVTIDAKFEKPITTEVAEKLHAEVLDRSVDAVDGQVFWKASVEIARKVGARIIVECFYSYTDYINRFREYYKTLTEKWMFPNGTIILDPIQAAMLTVDGSFLINGQFVHMCTLNPKWIQYIKDMARMTIELKGDGYYLDNMVPDYFWGAGYDAWSVNAFRGHLNNTFTKQELVSIGIEDVTTFNPADYFKKKGYLDTNSNWNSDPVWKEFIKFHLKSYLNNLREIKDIVKQLNSSFSFHGNPGNFPWPWIPMVSEIEDIVQVENWYERDMVEYDFPLPNRMLSWLKTYYSSSLGRKPVWVFNGALFWESEDYLRFMIAEAYASGVLYEVSYTLKVFLPTGGYHEFLSDPKHQAKLAAAEEYTGFIKSHRDLFFNVTPRSRVALIYSVPTVMWNYAPLLVDGWRWRSLLTSLQGFALALEHAHIPYDILSFGHPEFMNDTYTLSRLGLYDAIILPSVECLSAAQLDALKSFVSSGGRLILVGPKPSFNEDRVPLRDEEIAWLKGEGEKSLGLGTIVNLSDSPYENEATKYWLSNIARQECYAPDLSFFIDTVIAGRSCDVETNASQSVAVTYFVGNDSVILHLLNYAYYNGSINNIWLSVKLPDGFIPGDIVLASPDQQEDIRLKYSAEEDRVVLTIPKLEIWDIVTICRKPEFERMPYYSVIIDSLCSLDSIHGGGNYPEGINVTVTLDSPVLGYANKTRMIFSGWTTNITWENPDTSSTTFTFTLKSNVKITANWERQYYVAVETMYGKPEGEGWYEIGSQATVSIPTTRVEKDLFVCYVFEGWKVNGTIVSTSPTYSFIVDKPVTLVASWRTEIRLSAIGLIAGLILLVVVSTAILMARRRKLSPPQLQLSPSTSPTPIESETEKNIWKLEEYLEKLEQLKKERALFSSFNLCFLYFFQLITKVSKVFSMDSYAFTTI